MKNLFIAVVATAVIVGGVAFYGGMRYGEKSVGSSWESGRASRDISAEERRQRTGQFGDVGVMGGGGARAMGHGGDVVTGEVIAKDAMSVTVRMRDGGSKIVIFSGTTEVKKFVDGTMDDVSVGANVTMAGKANADGSVTAQSIQIRSPESPARARKP